MKGRRRRRKGRKKERVEGGGEERERMTDWWRAEDWSNRGEKIEKNNVER